jgi:hypothetical protein
METTETKAKAAIAMPRQGLRDFDLQRVARASTELVRTEVLAANHGIELSNTVGILRLIFHDIEEWERQHSSYAVSTKLVVIAIH